MAKKNEPHAPHPPTRRQLSHWQKQALRQRIIAIGGIVTVLAVVAVIVSGWYFRQYLPIDKPMHQTVLEVQGQKFNMAYFVDSVKYFDQVYYQGEPTYIPYILDTVEQNIEQIEIMKQAAADLGYSISDADVAQTIQNNSLDNNPAVRDIVRGQLLLNKLLTDYFGPQVPTTGEQRDVLAVFLESQSQADDIKAQIDAGADFGQLASQYSLESTTQSDNGAPGSHVKGVFDYLLNSTVLDDAIFSQPVGTWGEAQDADKTKQLGYWLVKVAEFNDDGSQAHISGMLLSSMEQAESIQSRLVAGEDFDTLAEQYSQDWSDTAGADLGWITADSSAVYKSYAFNPATSVGTVSNPIKDTSQSTAASKATSHPTTIPR